MKEILLKLAFYLLKKYGVQYFIHPPSDLMKIVEGVVKSAQEKFAGESGEFKRAQVLRSVMNIIPEAKESQICLAIEMIISGGKKIV